MRVIKTKIKFDSHVYLFMEWSKCAYDLHMKNLYVKLTAV